MQPKFIDLSVNLENSASEPEPVHIEYVSHRDGARILTKESKLSPDIFPDVIAVNLERVRLTSHSGTHVDAPLHYGPTCGAAKAKSIDQMPLEYFFGTALMLDCCDEGNKEPIQLTDIENALSVQKLCIAAKDIVLIHSGADKLWGTHEYFTHFRGVSLQATQMLLDNGVKVIGIDSFGFDPPFHRMIDSYKQTNDQKALWPCHMLGRTMEYCQIERLTNLSMLPKDKKFQVSCFPIKLKGCGAAPSRVVAIIN